MPDFVKYPQEFKKDITHKGNVPVAVTPVPFQLAGALLWAIALADVNTLEATDAFKKLFKFDPPPQGGVQTDAISLLQKFSAVDDAFVGHLAAMQTSYKKIIKLAQTHGSAIWDGSQIMRHSQVGAIAKFGENELRPSDPKILDLLDAAKYVP